MQTEHRAGPVKTGRGFSGTLLTFLQYTFVTLCRSQAAKFDGKMTSWYHFDCFFDRQRPKSAGDIEHFDMLRWEDQEKINEKLKGEQLIYVICPCVCHNILLQP